MAGERVGKVQTVRGLIEPDQMGITLMHEHLLIDMRCRYAPSPEASGVAFGESLVSFRRLTDILHDPLGNRDNVVMLDEGESIQEALVFKQAGGGTMVDTTTLGLGRDPAALRRISAATGLHVSMGAGYYVYLSHPPDMDDRSEGQLYEQMVRDIDEGVDESGIKCGHLGEIGCERQTDNEMKVVRAAARAQRTTGAMLNIHQEYLFTPNGGHAIADAIEQAGGTLQRTVFSHMDGSERDFAYQESLLKRGLTLEYDVFGMENYDARSDMQQPQDASRVAGIKRLFDAGWGKQVVVAQDICMKMMMETYGGWGYGHILKRVLPRFRRAGLGDAEQQQLLVDNPRRLLPFVAPRG